MTSLIDLIHSIGSRLAELERRSAAQHWRGKVKEVDAKKGTARIIIGQDEDGNDVLSPPLPYAQTAGGLKLHSPPTVGQQMEISAGAGDMEQGTLRPLGWSKENAAPSDKGDEDVITRGKTTIRMRGDEVFVQNGDQTVHMKADGSLAISSKGKVVVSGSDITLDGPVKMTKGFVAGAGEGDIAGTFNGKLHTTKDITSDTKVQAPVLQGALIS